LISYQFYPINFLPDLHGRVDHNGVQYNNLTFNVFQGLEMEWLKPRDRQAASAMIEGIYGTDVENADWEVTQRVV
jgi:hypothetical protein